MSLGTSVVTSADYTATFDTLTAYNVADLSTYSEGGVNVQTPTSKSNYQLCGGAGCWYGNGGYNNFGTAAENFARISTVLGENMTALEFNMYSGGGSPLPLLWETYSGGLLTGSGASTYSGAGQLVTVTDTAGFDELRIGAFCCGGTNNVIGIGIGIDNLKIEVGAAASVPGPATLALLLPGLLALRFRRVRVS